jgi:hypothetical protein
MSDAGKFVGRRIHPESNAVQVLRRSRLGPRFHCLAGLSRAIAVLWPLAPPARCRSCAAWRRHWNRSRRVATSGLSVGQPCHSARRDCPERQDRSVSPRSMAGQLPCRDRIYAGDRQSAGRRGTCATAALVPRPFYDFSPRTTCGLDTRRDVAHASRDMVPDAGLGRLLGVHHFRVDPRAAEVRPVAATRIAVQERRMPFHLVISRTSW